MSFLFIFVVPVDKFVNLWYDELECLIQWDENFLLELQESTPGVNLCVNFN